MTALAALCGATFGIGVFLLARALAGTSVDELPAEDEAPTPAPVRPAVLSHPSWRLGSAFVAATAIGVLTGWPVGIALAGAGGFFTPSLAGGKARRDATHAHLDAIATWTEQLRDVMAAASGLEQAIVTTADHAPPPIRADVIWLAGAIQAGTSARTSLRRFAQRLADPAGDLVVAALILAAEGSPRQLGDLLTRLSTTTRDTVRMRLRVETGRARTRSSVRVVTTVTVLFSIGIVAFNPAYVEAYRTPIGQVVLVAVALCFGGAYWWLARSSRPSTTGRFLGGCGAPTRDPAPSAPPNQWIDAR